MLDKQAVRDDLVKEVLSLLDVEGGLSREDLACAREELSKEEGELPPEERFYPGAKTPQEALEVIDILEEFLNYVEAFRK